MENHVHYITACLPNFEGMVSRDQILPSNGSFQFSVVLGENLKAKFDSLDLIDLLLTLILEKKRKTSGGDRTVGFSFEEGREFAPLVFMLSGK